MYTEAQLNRIFVEYNDYSSSVYIIYYYNETQTCSEGT